jgi:hypothetical protein
VNLVAQDPSLLFFGIGNGAAASGFDGGKSEFRRPAEVDESACGSDGGAANASPAMNADPLAEAEAVGEAGDECPEGKRVRREVVIGNGVVEKLHSHALCQEAFIGQVQHFDLLLIEQRDQGIYAGSLEMEQFGVQGAAAARAESNRQRRGN